MRLKITIITFLIVALSVNAQNIELSFANPAITFDGGTFYEVDVMIAAVEGQADFKLGKGQVYINYDTAIFGTFINGSGGIEISYPQSEGYILGFEVFPGFGYYSTSGSGIADNSESRFSFAYQQAVSSGAIASNNVLASVTRLFHIKMEVTGSLPAVPYSPISFEDDETQVANCRDQFETACGPESGSADCAGFPGVVFNNALFNSAGAEVLSVAQNENAALQIYPNPTHDILNILGNLESIDKIDIFAITGQHIMQVTSNLKAIDVSLLDGGVYFLKLVSSDKEKIIKFIKE